MIELLHAPAWPSYDQAMTRLRHEDFSYLGQPPLRLDLLCGIDADFLDQQRTTR